MGTFSFKSSGNSAVAAERSPSTTSLPIGILTPLALGDDDLLRTSTDVVVQLTDNLRNLIMTNWGERLGFYDFGANLRPLTADLVTLDDFDSRAIDRIRSAVTRWMPFIDLVDFESNVDRASGRPGSITAIAMTISFNIPSLRVTNKKLRVTLFVI